MKNGHEARHLRELNELGSFRKKHMLAVAGGSLSYVLTTMGDRQNVNRGWFVQADLAGYHDWTDRLARKVLGFPVNRFWGQDRRRLAKGFRR
jgi:hypothetical protein